MKTTSLLGGITTVCLLCFALPAFAANGLYGDLTDDNMVDMNDLSDFSDLWLEDDCKKVTGIDLNGDCIINFREFSVFANNWRLNYTPTAASPQNLMVPPMGWDDTQVILIWSKPVDYSLVTDYKVYKDGVALGLSGRFDTTRAKLYYIVTGLSADTLYSFTVKSVNSVGTELATSNTCPVITTVTPTVLNIANPPYNAVNNGTTKNTAAIQQAINDCPAGGVVYVPTGGTGYLTGGIFLKSNMTLKVDGTLLGSSAAADYKWTCWRFPYYASGKNHMGLVNAYYDYNNPTSYGKPYGSITNVRICGSGVINGCQGYSASNPHTLTGTNNLTTLGTNEAAAHGDSSRGDLVTIKGINQVYVGGWGGPLTLVYPAMHTIFLSYCNGVTVADVNCDTFDVHNGDGINLCTSDTAYIFNSKFDTGDDCINMNAGQAQPGVDENVPDQNIRVFDCSTDRGHGGYVIGSFTAAWVQDSLVEDCFFKNTDPSEGIAIRMKTGSNNGGGGRRITCRDIRISGPSKQGILLDSHYNASGYPNAGPGQFSGNTYKNITVSSTGATIDVNGLSGTPQTGNTFDHITGNKKASLRYCTNSTFNYCTVVGSPAWVFGTGTSGLSGTDNTPQPTWP
jgi:exo-poly-alpha-galacturonosidase